MYKISSKANMLVPLGFTVTYSFRVCLRLSNLNTSLKCFQAALVMLTLLRESQTTRFNNNPFPPLTTRLLADQNFGMCQIVLNVTGREPIHPFLRFVHLLSTMPRRHPNVVTHRVQLQAQGSKSARDSVFRPHLIHVDGVDLRVVLERQLAAVLRRYFIAEVEPPVDGIKQVWRERHLEGKCIERPPRVSTHQVMAARGLPCHVFVEVLQHMLVLLHTLKILEVLEGGAGSHVWARIHTKHVHIPWREVAYSAQACIENYICVGEDAYSPVTRRSVHVVDKELQVRGLRSALYTHQLPEISFHC